MRSKRDARRCDDRERKRKEEERLAADDRAPAHHSGEDEPDDETPLDYLEFMPGGRGERKVPSGDFESAGSAEHAINLHAFGVAARR